MRPYPGMEDGVDWTQKFATASPDVRYWHALAYDSVRGRTVLFGGYKDLNDTWLWSGITWTQAVPETSPPERYGLALAYDSASGKTMLFGGRGTTTVKNDTWEWGGANWTQKSPATSPPVRYFHSLAYDRARGKTVLFGGTSNENSGKNDTWEWDGVNWTQKTPAAKPTARFGTALAYDSSRAKTVLFGGGVISGGILSTFNDTWEWDGVNWTQKFPATSPSVRYKHALAYDGIRGRTVLFGGISTVGKSDTWEWDGVNWTQIVPAASPPARYEHALAYDSARGKTVLFGGAYLNDTWEWDGVNWMQKFPAASPAGRNRSALAYDSARGKTVLFGGYDGNDRFSDTWEWDGGNSMAGQTVTINVMSTGVLSGTSIANIREVKSRFFSGGSGYPAGVTTHGVNLMAWYDNNWWAMAANSSSAASPNLVEWTLTDQTSINKLILNPTEAYVFAVLPLVPNGFGDPNCVDPATDHCDVGMVSTDYAEVTLKYTLP
jgi:hypothetical protein